MERGAPRIEREKNEPSVAKDSWVEGFTKGTLLLPQTELGLSLFTAKAIFEEPPTDWDTNSDLDYLISDSQVARVRISLEAAHKSKKIDRPGITDSRLKAIVAYGIMRGFASLIYFFNAELNHDAWNPEKEAARTYFRPGQKLSEKELEVGKQLHALLVAAVQELQHGTSNALVKEYGTIYKNYSPKNLTTVRASASKILSQITLNVFRSMNLATNGTVDGGIIYLLLRELGGHAFAYNRIDIEQ